MHITDLLSAMTIVAIFLLRWCLNSGSPRRQRYRPVPRDAAELMAKIGDTGNRKVMVLVGSILELKG